MPRWIMIRDIRVKVTSWEQLAATLRLLNLTEPDMEDDHE